MGSKHYQKVPGGVRDFKLSSQDCSRFQRTFQGCFIGMYGRFSVSGNFMGFQVNFKGLRDVSGGCRSFFLGILEDHRRHILVMKGLKRFQALTKGYHGLSRCFKSFPRFQTGISGMFQEVRRF